jgi:transposase
VDATQKYELIRPILRNEKTPKQVNLEIGVPLSTIYHYLKRFRESGQDVKSLVDRSHAIHSHPKRLTREDKGKVIKYKFLHPHLSSRQIAEALAQEGILQISYRTVANVFKEQNLNTPFLTTNHPN